MNDRFYGLHSVLHCCFGFFSLTLVSNRSTVTVKQWFHAQ